MGYLISSAYSLFSFILQGDFLCPRHFQWGGVGSGGGVVHIVSTLSVRTCPVSPVRNTFGFRAISFERISVLD